MSDKNTYKKIADYYIKLYKNAEEQLKSNENNEKFDDKQIKHYVLQEKALQKLFKKVYPENNNLDAVLIKVAALNQFYSTRIMSVYAVANRIVDLVQGKDANEKIDSNTAQWDTSVVEKIKSVEISGKGMNFYSFATKYCCQYNYDVFPIYDGMVERTLQELNKNNIVKDFSKSDLKSYSNFKKIIDNLREDLDFDKNLYSYKDFDNFLWLYGRDLKVMDKIISELTKINKSINVNKEVSVEDLHAIGNAFRARDSERLFYELKNITSDCLTIEVVEKIFLRKKFKQ